MNFLHSVYNKLHFYEDKRIAIRMTTQEVTIEGNLLRLFPDSFREYSFFTLQKQ